ncbi:SusC/RagA family TonB-linked outer membrane protein [Duncaniella freteri]|uniref:SusC/RagA family TonB-linked outer membrane protein n=1 Tax=Duncaniella freteri TaxID=2530391 RepID=UPI00256EA046|nr:SusC/RagA family TonB-linked outer membrane protein [Duncaniella freteri]
MKQCNAILHLFCALVMSMPILGTQDIYAQSSTQQASGRLIMGQVLDDEGEPLPGATVRIKGSKGIGSATTTAGNGTFSLNYQGDSSAPTLSVSYIGMVTKDVKVDFKKTMKITLESDALKLSEVTVVDDGYNRLPRRDMVGAYTTIKAEDVIIPGYQSIDQMLQGRVAGMIVSNNSARVGSMPNIKIRGTSTILGNTSPLWVVDGVIQPDPIEISASEALTDDMATLIGNQVSWLNPLDIETITVLKDASATAIYGSKASNGVIVITTKKGSSERVAVRYSGSVSIRERSSYDKYDKMNSLERIQFSKEAYDAGARYATAPVPQIYSYEGLMAMFNDRLITADQFAHHMQRLETVNTDWLDLLTRTSVSNNHNLSISGGTSKVTYNASFGYSNDKGVEIGNDQDQITSRLNVGIDFSKRLRVDVNMNGSVRNSDGYAGGANPQSYALNTSRALPAYNEDGTLAYYQNTYSYPYGVDKQRLYGYNILNELANTYSNNQNKTFSTSVNASYKILEVLSYQFVGSINQSTNNTESYIGENASYIEKNFRGYPAGTEEYGSTKYKEALLPRGGQLSTTSSTSTSYSMTHKLQYSQVFDQKHRLNGLAGFEMRSVKNKSNTNTVWGYIPERGQTIIMPPPPGQLVGGSMPEWGIMDSYLRAGSGWNSYERTDNYLSLFSVLAYSYDNRYVLNANFRWDASNRFGQDTNNRFNPTYSFGFSWRIAQENFIKENLWWLNQLNLRTTYGIQGNVVNSVSPELLASYGGYTHFYNQFVSTISSLPNPYLKWESTKSWNFGLDLQLFSKVTMNLEYYTRSSNALTSQKISEEYGRGSMNLNGGLIHNHGVEMTVNYTPISNKDFAWTIGFNMSKNWNRSETPENILRANKPTTQEYLAGGKPLKEGYPLSGFWSYSFAGLSSEGYPTFNMLDFEGPVNVDLDPTTFLVYSGERDAYFTGGFNTRLRYKGISLSTSFSALLGGHKRLPNPYSSFDTDGRLPSPYDNLSKTLNDRWKQPGDEYHTNIPALWTVSEPGRQPKIQLPNSDIMQNIYSLWASSDVRVVDSSFLRCNNISLSYYLPTAWCNKFGAQSLSVSANVSNLFVIADSKWNGYDPELGSSRMPHMYSFGLNVSF